MNEQNFMDADYEVISMVNRGRGDGGELPTVKLAFIPSDRADRVLELDRRIQAIREKSPLIVTVAIVLAFLVGLAL